MSENKVKLNYLRIKIWSRDCCNNHLWGKGFLKALIVMKWLYWKISAGVLNFLALLMNKLMPFLFRFQREKMPSMQCFHSIGLILLR